MPAISYTHAHASATHMADVDAPWHAGAQVGAAEGESELTRMHAWRDPDGDPNSKSSYKLPHHMKDGKAVWHGVSAAGSATMGARGGVNIPEADVAGVRVHLAHHYRDFDKTPPWESAQESATMSEQITTKTPPEAAPVTQPERATLSVALVTPSQEGNLWDVTLCRAGMSQNKLFYPPETLKAAIPMLERANCYDSHLTNEEMAHSPNRKIGDLLGWLDGIRWTEATQSLDGKFHVAPTWLRSLLMNLHADHRLDMVGLSLDTFYEAGSRQIEGVQVKAADKIVKVNSVDLVTQPAAGGSINRLIESLQLAPTPAQEAIVTDPAIELRLYQLELRESLADSDMPKAARDFLWTQYKDRIVTPQRITEAIALQRQMLATMNPGATISAQGIIRDVRPVMEISNFERDLEAICGWADPSYKPRTRRLSEWYFALTGDEKFFGTVTPQRAAEANVTTSTLANICASLLNKRLLAEWAPMDRWWESIVTEHTEPLYQTVRLDKTYGFSALSTVGEGEPYTEKTWDDIAETATFSKKGNYVGITLEAIMADNVGAIKRIPGALARSWYYTVSDLVSGVFTEASGTGPTMADATVVFQVAIHANLLTAALDFDSFDAAQVAMMSQTEPGSSRMLGVPGKYLLVPINLRTDGYIIRNTTNRPYSLDNDVNSWYEQFEVVVVPPWSDTNNWALAADPKRLPCISLHYLQGFKTPELFTADAPNEGAMFTNDELRIKIRGMVARGVSDFRGLHKNNV